MKFFIGRFPKLVTIMYKFFLSLFIIVIFINYIFISISYAEVKVYEAIGEYYMSKYEAPDIAKQRAKENALRYIGEQANFLIESNSRVKNSQLTEDEITIICVNFIDILEENYSSEKSPDGKFEIYKAIIKAKIDTNKFKDFIGMSQKEYNELILQIKKLQRKTNAQNEQLEDLRAKINGIENDQQVSIEFKSKFDEIDKKFLANEKYKEGYKLYSENNYKAAIEAYAKAIEIDSSDPDFYIQRGISYLKLRDYTSAINDYNEAIQLNSDDFVSYSCRALAYIALGGYSYAVEDCNKAIKLNSKNYLAYASRGFAYSQLGKIDLALKDVNKAIKLEPNDSVVYMYRGMACICSNNYSQAIEDFIKAIELDQDEVANYVLLAGTYATIGEYNLAIENYNRAIQLDVNNGRCYKMRGWCYQNLGKLDKAQSDFYKAKELGYQDEN